MKVILLFNIDSLSQVTLDAATDQYILNAELASSVEHCQCPPNYKGLSCEECAKGYYRVDGRFGGSCVKCECNGHADSCDVNTGICIVSFFFSLLKISLFQRVI